MPSRARTLSSILSGILLLGFVAWVTQDPTAFRRDWTLRLRMEQVEPGVYARPGQAVDLRSGLLAELRSAELATQQFFGSRLARPTIALADAPALKEYLAVGNPFAATFFHRDGILAVVTPRGLNAEVMAHMLAHAEIKHRIGEAACARMPAWFDEGLSTLLDERPFLQDNALDAKAAALKGMPDMHALTGREAFVGSEGEANLVLAKLEVRRWHRIVGQDGVVGLLEALAGGAEFQAAYRAAEAAAGLPE